MLNSYFVNLILQKLPNMKFGKTEFMELALGDGDIKDTKEKIELVWDHFSSTITDDDKQFIYNDLIKFKNNKII